MASSNGNIFDVTGLLCDEFTGQNQWHGAFMLALICAWTNGWANNGDAGDLRRHRAHYDAIEMIRGIHGGFLSQRVSDTEKDSMPWRHHVIYHNTIGQWGMMIRQMRLMAYQRENELMVCSSRNQSRLLSSTTPLQGWFLVCTQPMRDGVTL